MYCNKNKYIPVQNIEITQYSVVSCGLQHGPTEIKIYGREPLRTKRVSYFLLPIFCEISNDYDYSGTDIAGIVLQGAKKYVHNATFFFNFTAVQHILK